MEYTYPLSYDWTKEEIVDAVAFFQTVEAAYEKGVKKEKLMSAYRRFKEIVPGKSEEKQLCGEFEKDSGYSPYRTVKAMKEAGQDEIVKMQAPFRKA